MDFLKWYKNRILSSELEPPADTWNQIQDQLDIDSSWNAINSQLAQQSRSRRLKFISVAASFVFLISIGSYFLFNTSPIIKDTYVYVQDLNKTVEKASESAISDRTEIAKNIIPNNSNISNDIISSIYQPIDNKDLVKEQHVIKNMQYDQEITKLTYKTTSFDDTARNTLLIAKTYKPQEEVLNEEKERESFKKFYLGATGQLANTWVLNEKTYHGFESTSLTTSNATFGSNFGIYAGANLSNRIDLQLDINILAKNNQDYNEYLNGKYIEEKLSFNYSQAAISVRFNFLSKTFLHGEHGINIGGYAGYLHNVYQILDQNKINLSDDYDNVDYGLVLSYEYLIPISKKLGFGTGVRAYYGLKNIYAGNETIPSYLNKTNNASINISFTLKYNISK